MTKKKVGIITSYLDFDKNYGGVLQAYALSRQISLLGYDAYIMPYIYNHISKSETSFLKRFLRNVKSCIIPSRRKLLKQEKLFKTMMKFVNSTLPIYGKKRISVEQLKKEASDFHAFVCGSDQVWSTRLQRNHCDPGMFLKFVPESVKKVAYAPSLGATRSVSPETAEEIKAALKDFSGISVREREGQKLLAEITGREYPVVLDPTLLLPLEEWDNISAVPEGLPDEYMVVYRFGDIPSNFEKIKEIQRHLNIPIIELPSSQLSLTDGLPKRFDIDPGMFIGLLKNAKLVCTDSFHATVFSILTKTPFVCFYRQDPASEFNMNSRLDDLLETTGLSHRMIGLDGTVDYEGLFNVDFENAHKKIDLLRKGSLDYLTKALS